MKCTSTLLALCLLLAPTLAYSQDRAAIKADFDVWLEETIWARAQAADISRSTFDAALSDAQINWALPNLVLAGAPIDDEEFQAEFRPPARYFDANDLAYSANIGRDLLGRHAATLDEIERSTGVPAQVLLAIWWRESSFGKAAIPHDAFDILSTKGFLSSRPAYFSDELIAALQILERGFASRDQMKSSWAGALGQPQFMPSSYLKYAVDGDGDGRADIWKSQGDTLASIASYLQQHGWSAERDWGFEVTVPNTISCALEGPDQGQPIAQWAAMGVARISGSPFPAAEASEDGYLLMPAGRYGPAFIVTSNFYVLKDYNESDVYALFVGHVGDRMKYGGDGFQAAWRDLDALSPTDIIEMQTALEARGYDVGGVDGLIGYKTRRSIGQWQAQNDRDETCYPSTDTLLAIGR